MGSPYIAAAASAAADGALHVVIVADVSAPAVQLLLVGCQELINAAKGPTGQHNVPAKHQYAFTHLHTATRQHAAACALLNLHEPARSEPPMGSALHPQPTHTRPAISTQQNISIVVEMGYPAGEAAVPHLFESPACCSPALCAPGSNTCSRLSGGGVMAVS